MILNVIRKIIPQRWHWIFEHEGYKRYAASTGWMFAVQVISLIVSFFIGTWIARYLGVENYGMLSYSISFAGMFGFIASLGIDNILSRELVKFPHDRNRLLGTGFRLKIIGGLIAFLFAFIGACFTQTNPLIKLLIVLFSLSFIFQAMNVVNIYFQAEVRSKNSFKSILVATLISSILKILIILSHKGVAWIVLVFSLDFLWQAIGFGIAYRAYGLKIRDWIFDKSLAMRILKNSLPLMISAAAGFIYLKIDQVIIGHILGNREVGLYAAAVKLVEVWYFIPWIISTALFPAIINARKMGMDLYNKRLKNFYILLFTLSLIIAIPTTLFAPFIIYVLFGEGYSESVSVLYVYTWSSIGLFLSYGINQYLISENLVKTILFLNIIVMCVNIFLNLFFIPRYGIIGSAWATFSSYLIIPLFILLRPAFKSNR